MVSNKDAQKESTETFEVLSEIAIKDSVEALATVPRDT